MAVLRYFHQDPKQTSVQESSIVDRLGTALTLKLTNINQSINNNTLAIDDKLNSIPGKSLSTNDFTDEYKDKLRGIEEGAEVNVQSDWGEDDNTADSYIKNKPIIDTVVTDGSNNLVTSGAVFTAIDELPEPMIFKGSLGTGGTIQTLPAPSADNVGFVYKVITAGVYYGIDAKPGDSFISDGLDWILIPSGDEPEGTVMSIGLTVPTGLKVSGSPITTSGTLAISYALGYAIPTTAKQEEWDAKQDAISDLSTIRSNASRGETAYGWGNHALAGYQPAISDLSTIRSNASEGHTAYGWGDHAKAGYVKSSGVTSVAMTVPTGLSISGSPITSTGTLALSFANGYSIPTTAKLGNWDTAYSWGNHASAGYVKSSGVTKISTTDGVVGGDITTTGTIKANLASYTKNASDIGGKLYGVQLDKSGRLAVDVPWVNTTYNVVSKTANGLVPQLPNETTTTKYLRQDGTWQVPPNTTYSAGTKALYDTGTDTANRVWSAAVLKSIGGEYLPLTGGTMIGTANINWADSGNWSSGDTITYPVVRGGLRWVGLSDYCYLYSEETTRDNLDLVLRFGDDNSNGLSVRNKDNTETGRISATGIFTATKFVKSGGTSSQFLKADGSIDSNSYLTSITKTMVTNALGYTPPTQDTNTWKPANTSLEGYAPKLTTGGGTIATLASEYVLTFKNGTDTAPVWRLLPANAYLNNTYTVNDGTLNLLASGTTKTTFTANQSGTSTFNIATGSTNGTISVGGADVAVKGLGSRAYDSTNYLPLAGGVLTGDLSSKRSNFDLSKDDNGVKATTYPTTFNILDSGGRISARLENIVKPNGTNGFFLYTRQYNTQGSQFTQRGISYSLTKAGVGTWNVSDAPAFRTALGLGARATDNTNYLPLTGGTISNGTGWASISFSRTGVGNGVCGGIDGNGLYFYHSDGTNSLNMYLKAADGLRVGGNLVWNLGNDGSGSGLDADLLDGYHASSLVHNASASNVFTDEAGWEIIPVLGSNVDGNFSSYKYGSCILWANNPNQKPSVVNTDNWYNQLFGLTDNRLYFRTRTNGGSWTTLNKLAYISDIPTNNNQLTNGAGYITGITKTMVTNALGYTPPTADTNNAVTLTSTTTDAFYRLLFSDTADDTNRTEGARKNTNIKVNPSYGGVHANGFFHSGASLSDTWTDSNNKNHPWYGIDFRAESGSNYFHSVYSDYFGMCFRTCFIKIAIGDYSAGAAKLARTIYINNAVDTNPIIFSVAGTISAENRLLAPKTNTTYIDGIGSDETDPGPGPLYILCNQDEPVVIAANISGDLASRYVGIGKINPSYKLHVNGACAATSFPNTSDIRLKDILKEWAPQLLDIADAPLFLFKWNDRDDNNTHLGTSAQYWENKVPEVVTEARDEIGTKSLQYDVLGVANTITLAREVVSLKEEIKLLQALIAELKLLLNN